VTARNLAIAAVVVFAIGVAALMRTPFGGWLQSFVYGPGVRWEDAYRGLDAAEPAGVHDIERRRLAWAQAEDEPPAGLTIGPRRHRPGVLARLRDETFDLAGAPLEAWEVRARVCRPRVRIGAVTRLEFYPFTTVPIPKGFVTTRWVQLDGCPR